MRKVELHLPCVLPLQSMEVALRPHELLDNPVHLHAEQLQRGISQEDETTAGTQ